MKKYIIVIPLIIMLLGNSSYGIVPLIVNSSVTYGTYSMSSFKDFQALFQEEYQSRYHLQLRSFGDFPPYFTYRIGLKRRFSEKLAVGIFYKYTSTGSRITLSDYSGRLATDFGLSQHAIGTNMEGLLFSLNKNTRIISLLEFGLTEDILSLIEHYKILDRKDRNNLWAHSTGAAAEVGAGLQYYLQKYIFTVSARMHFDLYSQPMYQSGGNGDVHLRLENGDPLKAEWQGIRLGITVGYRLG